MRKNETTRNIGPKEGSIKEMVSIPAGLEEYVNDYKIHVFEIAYLTEDQVKLFRSDFRIVADYFVQKRKNKDECEEDISR